MLNTNRDTKKIVKNTIVLYVRMFFLMAISLYTSRVILEALGVVDYGIYNVVGGFVALFSVVSKSLSGAASRFLNFEMGRGGNVGEVFSSILIIHIGLAIIIALMAETLALWFLNEKMVIPSKRLYAANWCFQLSIITFIVNLISVPYNAAIIAHEHMKAFAYVSIVEGVCKLAISFAIIIVSFDRLIFFAILLCVLQILLQIIYGFYCARHFEECRSRIVFEASILKKIFGFSTWGFIGSTSGILRNHGINLLLNLFFGPTINAARAVANQVLHAVDGFVNNFIVAVRPQIVQSYASGDYSYMNKLIVMGGKISFYLFLMLSTPIIVYSEDLLAVWLKIVPGHSVLFSQLTLIFTLVTTLSHPLSIAQAATGKIRDYQLVVGGMQLLNLPISYLLLKMGLFAESVMLVAISIAMVVVFVSIYMLHRIMQFEAKHYLTEVVVKSVLVAMISISGTFLLKLILPDVLLGVVIGCILSAFFVLATVFTLGCNSEERNMVVHQVRNRIIKLPLPKK